MNRAEKLNQLVVPGIVPELPEEIQEIFFEYGTMNRIKKGYIGHDENAEPNPLIMVNKGCFFHGVTNAYLSKEIAISLLPQGRMLGFVNFFSRERMPSKSGALEPCEIYTLPYEVLYNKLTGNLLLHNIFSKYQEKCNKSDMYSMLWIMTQPIEERIKMLFTATLITFGYDFNENTLENWVQIPLNFTRTTISKVAYSSTLSINRYLAKWTRKGIFKRENRKSYIKPVELLSSYEWIMERS